VDSDPVIYDNDETKKAQDTPVMSSVIFMSCRLISHARGLVMQLGCSEVFRPVCRDRQGRGTVGLTGCFNGSSRRSAGKS